MAGEDRARRVFFGLSGLVFVACAAATIASSRGMAAMGGTPMPGGWWLTGTWAPMCGQTWLGAAGSFLVMWAVMMGAMMAPSMTPLLWRGRRALAPVLAGYGLAWGLAGAAIFPLAAVLANLLTVRPDLARPAPFAAGLVVLAAGAVQFTRWKARHLAACRTARPASLGQGLSLGVHCCCACAGPMAVLLIVGIMDLRAMALATAAITAERLAPAGRPVAQALGLLAMAIGTFLIARAGWT